MYLSEACLFVADDAIEDAYSESQWRRTSRGHILSWRDDPTKLVYLKMCKQLGIFPLARIAKGLSEELLEVKNVPLGPVGTKACAVALVVSRVIHNVYI